MVYVLRKTRHPVMAIREFRFGKRALVVRVSSRRRKDETRLRRRVVCMVVYGRSVVSPCPHLFDVSTSAKRPRRCVPPARVVLRDMRIANHGVVRFK